MHLNSYNQNKVKINFGCSSTNCPGWINIDNALGHILITKIPGLPFLLYKLGLLKKESYQAHIQGKFKNVRYGDVRKTLPFKNNTVDYIYHSHLLEHLHYDEGIKFLKECYRILKPGGLMRIVLPDLEGEAKKYIKQIEKGKTKQNFTDEFVKLFFSYGHKWMYDRFSLSKILRDIGFSKITICSYRKGKCPDIDKLDVRPNSLFMEAEK
jgi:predicted SAM-dependent methyltransferase